MAAAVIIVDLEHHVQVVVLVIVIRFGKERPIRIHTAGIELGIEVNLLILKVHRHRPFLMLSVAIPLPLLSILFFLPVLPILLILCVVLSLSLLFFFLLGS